MEYEKIKFIYNNQFLFLGAWYALAGLWVFFMGLGYKYISYTFIVEDPLPFFLLWACIVVLTGLLSYSAVYIFFVEKIKRKMEVRNGRKNRKKR